MALRPSLDRVSMAEHRSHTSALDVDLSGDGISVTTVAVGLIDTHQPPKRHREGIPNISHQHWLQSEADTRAVLL